ncbi:hypothetical protein [Salinicola halimionae]|uniref:hypothetical protein n=1 Tax=Salinicola halimionae TaxID=1949081 RepID=UPI001CB6F936|nr:hypothetical protein [Salinicola halimionae]
MKGYVDFTVIGQEGWLKSYYFFRAGFSAIWVATAFTAERDAPMLTMILLVLYPAWDAAANFIDAQRSGGWGRNRVQSINVFISAFTALSVVVALQMSDNSVLAVFGVWAILSGLLQLSIALGRWKRCEASWALVMILSGLQSAWAGAFFLWLARLPAPPLMTTVAYYAALGAIYFLISAIGLFVSELRRSGF